VLNTLWVLVLKYLWIPLRLDWTVSSTLRTDASISSLLSLTHSGVRTLTLANSEASSTRNSRKSRIRARGGGAWMTPADAPLLASSKERLCAIGDCVCRSSSSHAAQEAEARGFAVRPLANFFPSQRPCGIAHRASCSRCPCRHVSPLPPRPSPSQLPEIASIRYQPPRQARAQRWSCGDRLLNQRHL
jgi:hypothetical protein